jgi:hypothetical protein
MRGCRTRKLRDCLFEAAMAALTPDEVAMPSDELWTYLAAASAIAIRELDSEVLH